MSLNIEYGCRFVSCVQRWLLILIAFGTEKVDKHEIDSEYTSGILLDIYLGAESLCVHQKVFKIIP